MRRLEDIRKVAALVSFNKFYITFEQFGCSWVVTDVTVVEPNPVSVVFAVAFHAVVCEVALGHFIIRIDHDLNGREKAEIDDEDWLRWSNQSKVATFKIHLNVIERSL